MIRFTRAAPVYAALTLILIALAPVLATTSTSPAQATAAVTIQNFAFSPQTLTVAPGTKVVWTNQDSVAHTVTSDSGAWTSSGHLATGS